MKKSEYKALSDGERQRLLSDFTNKEIIYLVSPLIDGLFPHDLDIYEYLENFEEDKDGNYPEVFEWYIVSDYLAEKLAEKKEVIAMDFLGLTIWGRQCTGQAILLDKVIEDIYIKYMLD
jgi:hypothetical protein